MIHGWEDWDFWLSLLELDRKVHRIPKVLFYYRVSEASMIEGMSPDKQARMRLQLIHNHRALYENLVDMELRPLVAHLFLDTGSGFHAQSPTLSRVISPNETGLEFDVSEHPVLRSVRFGPANEPVVVDALGASAETFEGSALTLQPVDHNAVHCDGSRWYFADPDPWVTFEIPQSGVGKVRFTLQFAETGKAAARCILEKRHSIMEEQGEKLRKQMHRIVTLENLARVKESRIQVLGKQIQAKDVHIDNLERELERIHSMFIWRIVNMMRLLKRSADTLREEGVTAVWKKARSYLRRRRGGPTLAVYRRDYDKWVEQTALTDSDRKKIRKGIERFSYRPKISIVMPVYNVERRWLEKALDSVLAQLYENWELCIADDASTEPHIRKTLEAYENKDPRIRVAYLSENRGISLASNEALALATGEFVALLDNDDELTENALYENVRLLNQYPYADMIYSDEDKLDMDGKRCEPHFKPDWSPEMYLCHNYTCHFGVYRKSLIDEIGGFRKGYEGSQDYDLVLRFIEKTENIYHIPKVLYHWRMIPGSAADSTDAKRYAYVAGKQAVEDYVRRNGIDGVVEDGLFLGSYRVRYRLRGTPEVSIIIPFRDKASVLETCVDSILRKTTYPRYRILLVDNGSREEETIQYLKGLEPQPAIQVLKYDRPFNYSAINNYAASQTDSEYVLFLNNDTEVISKDWIEVMLEHAQREEVGGVGALLYYPDDTVQHAGVILGLGGIAGHSHSRVSRESFGYFGRMKVVHNLSAVTAACMMTRRSLFEEVGGFDESVTHAFNDVDLCLKIREKGYRIVYTPYAELYHHESLSRGYEDTPEKQARFQREIDYIYARWKTVLEAGDPYYNPNLTLKNSGWTVE